MLCFVFPESLIKAYKQTDFKMYLYDNNQFLLLIFFIQEKKEAMKKFEGTENVFLRIN